MEIEQVEVVRSLEKNVLGFQLVYYSYCLLIILLYCIVFIHFYIIFVYWKTHNRNCNLKTSTTFQKWRDRHLAQKLNDRPAIIADLIWIAPVTNLVCLTWLSRALKSFLQSTLHFKAVSPMVLRISFALESGTCFLVLISVSVFRGATKGGWRVLKHPQPKKGVPCNSAKSDYFCY